jgi:hypothetical protein
MLKRRQLFIMLITMALALLPRVGWAAGCGIQDLGACVDGAQYTFWFGLAALGWSIDRTLLLLAYQLDTLRWWLVEVAFSTAYQLLIELVDPLIVPFASVAITIGCLALLLLPLFGRIELVKIRHALTWVALAPIVLTLSGPLVVQSEELRSQVSNLLFNGVSSVVPGAMFGVNGSDMAEVVPLYPANPCGVTLARHGVPSGRGMDDLAAALLWADAEDIHCPEQGGPSGDLPDHFYVAVPDGPGYATGQAVGEMHSATERTAAVDAMQRGAIRCFLGILPVLLAVLDALVQLIFALCLVSLWIGLPIGILFVFFQQTADPVTGLLRRMIAVLQVSWSSSVLLGLLFTCLLSAAELRNAAAYTGFAIGALLLTGYLLVVAVDTLNGCLRTLSGTVAVATGLDASGAIAMASRVSPGGVGGERYQTTLPARSTIADGTWRSALSHRPNAQIAAELDSAEPQSQADGHTIFLDPATRRVNRQPGGVPEGTCGPVLRERREQVNLPRLLLLGYTVQEHGDDTLSFWSNSPDAARQCSPEQHRHDLIVAGAIVEQGGASS